MKIDEESMRKILAALDTRGALAPCPRCTNRDITLTQQVIDLPLRGTPEPAACVGVLCKRCGYLVIHLLAVLGIEAPEVPTPRIDLKRFAPPPEVPEG